jgi:hypothetical protein
MLVALLLGTVAFSVVYGYLMAVRLRVGRLEDHATSTVMSRPSPRARAPRPAPASPQPVGGERHA